MQLQGLLEGEYRVIIRKRDVLMKQGTAREMFEMLHVKLEWRRGSTQGAGEASSL